MFLEVKTMLIEQPSSLTLQALINDSQCQSKPFRAISTRTARTIHSFTQNTLINFMFSLIQTRNNDIRARAQSKHQITKYSTLLCKFKDFYRFSYCFFSFYLPHSLFNNYNPPFSSFEVEKLYTIFLLCIQTKNGVFRLKNLNISHDGGLKHLQMND
jgi:hypothetical protein